MKIAVHLNFSGDCAEAFKFYEKCLGGKIEAMIPHGGTPMAGDVPAGWKDKIMHAYLTVGDQAILGADMPSAERKGFAVALFVDRPAEADRAFGELAEGGTVTMPIEKTFWAERFGMLTDRFGTPWMVNCTGSVEYKS